MNEDYAYADLVSLMNPFLSEVQNYTVEISSVQACAYLWRDQHVYFDPNLISNVREILVVTLEVSYSGGDAVYRYIATDGEKWVSLIKMPDKYMAMRSLGDASMVFVPDINVQAKIRDKMDEFLNQ